MMNKINKILDNDDWDKNAEQLGFSKYVPASEIFNCTINFEKAWKLLVNLLVEILRKCDGYNNNLIT